MPAELAAPDPAAGGPPQHQPWAPVAPGGSGVYSGANGQQAGPFGLGIETSGSLTGHILGQGHPDVPQPKSRAKVVVVLLLVVAILVAAGVAAATFGGDAIGAFVDGLFSG